MVKQAKKLNHYQMELNFEIVNYSIIEKKLKQFENYYKYWNYVKLWNIQQKVWMLSPFKHINLKSSKMVEIVEEGQELVFQLLQTLEKKESIYPNVLKLEQ